MPEGLSTAPYSFRFRRSGEDISMLISNQFPGDVDAAGPGTSV